MQMPKIKFTETLYTHSNQWIMLTLGKEVLGFQILIRCLFDLSNLDDETPDYGENKYFYFCLGGYVFICVCLFDGWMVFQHDYTKITECISMKLGWK